MLGNTLPLDATDASKTVTGYIKANQDNIATNASNITALGNKVGSYDVTVTDNVATSKHANIDNTKSVITNVEALGDDLGVMGATNQGNIHGGAFSKTNTVAANLEKLDQAIGKLDSTGVLEATDTDTSVAHQLSALNDKIGGSASDINELEGRMNVAETDIDNLENLVGTKPAAWGDATVIDKVSENAA